MRGPPAAVRSASPGGWQWPRRGGAGPRRRGGPAPPPARRRRALVAHALPRVTMRRYTDEEIEASIARGDPFDKAGAYAIQDPRLAPVESYVGCYCNVGGLPLWTTGERLRGAGV